MKQKKKTDIRTAYSLKTFRKEATNILALLRACPSVATGRRRLFRMVSETQRDSSTGSAKLPLDDRVIVRDCARVLRTMLKDTSEANSGFSVAKALWDIAHGRPRPDLKPGFFAEMTHLIRGTECRGPFPHLFEVTSTQKLTGRTAAIARCEELDGMWEHISTAMSRYPDGLSKAAIKRRYARRDHILKVMKGSIDDWTDWRWQLRHIIKTPEKLASVVSLSEEELKCVREACEAGLPFGVTPYYASLMDNEPGLGRDVAIRAQVLPPSHYVDEMSQHRNERHMAMDFMLERDTSPIDLITRRYPAIAILKPVNTCPQICTYCQRNWQIDGPIVPESVSFPNKIEAALQWIEDHPAITELLMTGGDPFILNDTSLEKLLTRVGKISSLDLIRIGSRTLVTMPMRVTDKLVKLLSSLRIPGQRDVAVITHVEHAYEITPQFVDAVGRLRKAGISVYNQHVFHFFVSRRFELAKLRTMLRRSSVDPYYTFLPKGKDETADFRLPMARLLQEQKEEARLLPGLRRTDEAVFNVPALGKNYLRAYQNRDFISVLPDGSRVYEFHPWEKMVARRDGYIHVDVPVLDYLERLQSVGEDPGEYASIWYYF